MGKNYSYSLPSYRDKQSRIAKAAWKRRYVGFTYKQETRKCARPQCTLTFAVAVCDSKRFCSKSCAAKTNNVLRGKRSEETKKAISDALKGQPNPYKGTIKVPRVEVVCQNPDCGKKFLTKPWRIATYCSNACSMRIVGGRPTSPKASRGKAGIRKDISPSIYFYSRWEANIARLYSHLGVKWNYAPRAFDIGSQMYTPDFYLPETDMYVEVKNFWWKYSKERDEKFRKRYKNIRLEVILKDEYLRLEKQYAHLIPAWEYKNSVFKEVK